MQVLRYPFDRSVLGRNAYANLYQFQAQLEYLKKLQSVRSCTILLLFREAAGASCRAALCTWACMHAWHISAVRHLTRTLAWVRVAYAVRSGVFVQLRSCWIMPTSLYVHQPTCYAACRALQPDTPGVQACRITAVWPRHPLPVPRTLSAICLCACHFLPSAPNPPLTLRTLITSTAWHRHPSTSHCDAFACVPTPSSPAGSQMCEQHVVKSSLERSRRVRERRSDLAAACMCRKART